MTLMQFRSRSDMPFLCHRYFLGPGQTVPQILALGLSSRKNLCVHPSVAGTYSHIPALHLCYILCCCCTYGLVYRPCLPHMLHNILILHAPC